MWYKLVTVISYFKLLKITNQTIFFQSPNPLDTMPLKIVLYYIQIYPSGYLAVSCQLQWSGYPATGWNQLLTTGWNPVVPAGWLPVWLAQRRMTSPLELFQPLSQCGRTVTAGSVGVRTGQDRGCFRQSHGLGGEGQQDTYGKGNRTWHYVGKYNSRYFSK